MLICLGSLVCGWVFKVGVVKERSKQHQIAEVHKRAPHNIIHVGRTVCVIHPVIDQAQHGQAHHHLQDLDSSD